MSENEFEFEEVKEDDTPPCEGIMTKSGNLIQLNIRKEPSDYDSELLLNRYTIYYNDVYIFSTWEEKDARQIFETLQQI